MIAALLLSVALATDVVPSTYARLGASAYSSSERLLGGIGGAVGVRITHGLLVAQTDVGLLVGLGPVFEWRAGVGVAVPGRWSPAALGMVDLMAGPQTGRPTDLHPLPLRGPAVTFGVDLEPLRFVDGRTIVSALQLGVGLGTDLPGLGVGLRIGFFEVAVTF